MSATLQIAAIMLAAAAPQAGDTRPLRLQIERDGAHTVIRVVGAAEKQMSAAYDLQVASAGNRSVQKGVAHLQPGVRTIVATVRLGGEAPASAKLRVRPDASSEYEEDARAR